MPFLNDLFSPVFTQRVGPFNTLFLALVAAQPVLHQNRLLKLPREGRKMSGRDLADFAPAVNTQQWSVY